jgi:hypothetical protein
VEIDVQGGEAVGAVPLDDGLGGGVVGDRQGGLQRRQRRHGRESPGPPRGLVEAAQAHGELGGRWCRGAVPARLRESPVHGVADDVGVYPGLGGEGVELLGVGAVEGGYGGDDVAPAGLDVHRVLARAPAGRHLDGRRGIGRLLSHLLLP